MSYLPPESPDESAHTADKRRRIPGGGAARAGGGAGRTCHGEYRCAEPGTERDGAVADAAAADRVQSNRGAGMGHRRNAGGLRDRGAAQTFAGKTGHGDFRNQSRRESRRECLLLRNSGRGARRHAASHSVGGDVALLEKDGSEIRKLRARGAGHRGNDFERRIAGPGFAQRECAGAVERRREIHAAIAKDHTQPTQRRKRSARAQLLLAIRTKTRQKRGAGHGLRRDFFRRRFHHAAAPRPDAHRIAESSFSLGRANRSRFSALSGFRRKNLLRRKGPDFLKKLRSFSPSEK